ncbi:MAG TPA: UpxY family transcription antiterminator [Bryobacteraceae bacterium]|nr:UpxY family transcription antiterminator [Bryobacteraceae bacterium]
MQSEENSHQWFAVKVRVKNELAVETVLRGKNYETLLPTYTDQRRYSDRIRKVEMALYPGYIFCRFDPTKRLPILTTPSVEYIVGNGKTPQAVEDRDMEAIQRLIDSGADARPWPFLQEGQRVRIEEGSLSGVEGYLVTIKGSDRLVLSVELLQRSVAVHIDRAAVRPLPN